jgi:hypothetical protein
MQHRKHMSGDHYLLLSDVTADTENTASSVVACWTVFTEPLPCNALIKSVPIYNYLQVLLTLFLLLLDFPCGAAALLGTSCCYVLWRFVLSFSTIWSSFIWWVYPPLAFPRLISLCWIYSWNWTHSESHNVFRPFNLLRIEVVRVPN